MIARDHAEIETLRTQNAQAREQNSELVAQLNEARERLAAAQAAVVDRSLPGQSAKDAASAAEIVQSNSPQMVQRLIDDPRVLGSEAFTVHLPSFPNDEAAAIVAEAADLFVRIIKSVPDARVVVVGYYDASVGDDEAMAISEREAKYVATLLVVDGVPADAILLDWKGRRELAVATPDGVAEPLNRYVSILLVV